MFGDFVSYGMNLVCSFCRREFYWVCNDAHSNSIYNRPSYCSNRHREEARLLRRRVEQSGGDVCPFPGKKSFVERDDALAVIVANHYGDDGLFPYLCVCGLWHNGHRIK